jgi:hypothetical protein
MIGQCHRYHAYDSRPTNCNGARSSNSRAPYRDAEAPPTSSATVPSTGRSAAVPGNRVDDEYANTDHTTAPSPSQEHNAAVEGRIRCSRSLPNATNAPVSNSHARAGREKNAHGCVVAVQRHDSRNDATASTASVTRIATTRRRQTRASANMSNG